MYLNKKNIVICIIIVVLINMSFNIMLNISRNEYLKKVIKNDSQEMLKDYIAYNDINIVLNSYLSSIKNSEYNKLNDMSLFYAKKSNSDYNILKEKLQLSDTYALSVDKVYVLEKNIYKCEFYVKSGDILSKKYIACIKLDSDKKYFRVLDFIVE